MGAQLPIEESSRSACEGELLVCIACLTMSPLKCLRRRVPVTRTATGASCARFCRFQQCSLHSLGFMMQVMELLKPARYHTFKRHGICAGPCLPMGM
ncbi:hypothetical protein HHK36_010402 [Tetracentron sinense]|uniref:Uncharacterized protein n=1 Tax=Tetracentron sinense TaxID=13715 RepID=A0A834ZGW1_TETSI|nr:hypothetical protein HHK36_010402 [Tetracentron sinense]